MLACNTISNGSIARRRTRVFTRFFIFVAALLAIVLPASSQTLDRHEPNRVVRGVSTGNNVQIADRLPAYVRNVTPSSQPSSDTMLSNLMVLLSRSPQTQAAFDAFVLDQQNPQSPNFHRFLAPIQVGQMFGPTKDDVAAVTSWLDSQGLPVDEVSPDMTRIVFHGTVAQVSSAFNVQFGTFNLQTKTGPQTRLASLSAPSVPAALSPVIQSIVGLYADPLVSYENGIEFPNTTNSHAMTPAAFNTQYSTTAILAAGYTGSGVRVAILGYSRVLAQDITDFFTAMAPADTYLNKAAQPNTIIPPTGVDPGVTSNQAEQTLDVTRVMSTAPGAIADLVVSGTSSGTDGLLVDLNYEVNTLVDPILTMSYGGCEAVVGQSTTNTYAALFQTAVAEGITPLVASADSGAECGNAWTVGFNVPTTPTVGVNYLCANPYVTCVGGTSLNDQPQVYVTPAGNGAVLTATVTSGAISAIIVIKGGSGFIGTPTIRIDGGGGTGATATATLVSGVINNVTVTSGGSGYKSTYWNDTGAAFSTLNGVVPEGTFAEAEDLNGKLQVAGSTGGFSTFATRPNFQTTALSGYTALNAAPYAGQRLVPDVAFSADPHDGYFLCLNLDCEAGNFRSEAGTSASSPGMAGIMALVVNRSGSQGWFNPTLYSLASARYANDFLDVTAASAGVAACTNNVPSHCNNDEPYLDASTQAKTAYTVGTGYDMVTGWGSVNAYNMLLDLRPPSPYNGTTYTATVTNFGSQPAVAYGGSLAANLNATTKAGSTDVTAKGVEGYFATASGGAPVAITSSTLLSVGSYTLSAIWQPTAANAGTYSSSYGTANLTVSKAAVPTTTLTSSATSVTPTTTVTLTDTLSVPGINAGDTVQFYDGTTKIGSAVTPTGTTTFTAVLSGQTFAAGSHSITAVYTSSNYATATSGAVTVVSTAPAATVALGASATSVSTTTSVTLTATVTTVGGSLTAGDTVQFYDGTNTLGSPAVVNTTTGVATLSQTFAAGSHAITAKFGDSTFATATSNTVTVVSTAPAATVALGASATTVSTTTSVTLTATVTTVGGSLTAGDTVQFYDGTNTLGSPAAVNTTTGIATLSQTFAAGTHAITAKFGDSTFATATSNTVTITSAVPVPTLSATAVTIASPGSSGASTITASSNGGFTGTIALACAVAWSGTGTVSDLPTCVASPNSLTLTSGGTATSTVTLTTIAAHGSYSTAPVHAGLTPLVGGGVLACMLFFFVPRRRRITIALLLLLGLTFVGISGCAGGGITDPGSSVGSYTVTVTGTYGTSSTVTTTFIVTLN